MEALLTAGRGLQVGRAPPSDLLIDHPSVSRSHACFEPEGEAWRLIDLGSKNGSFVNGLPADGGLLPANAWLRFGDITCELAELDDQALARAGQRRAARQTASVLHQRAIEQSQAPSDLLQATLAAVVDLADCERGFLLINQPEGPVVRAWQGLDDRALSAPAFSGSRGAVDRALRERRPVVINDAGQDAAFAGRASVVAGGLRSLVCLPLVTDKQVLGLAYADSRAPGHAITTLELDLLAAFAERAALWLAARRSELALAEVARQVRWPGATGTAA
ncbi:GAF domain-containing protein [Arenimonas aestuarii]